MKNKKLKIGIIIFIILTLFNTYAFGFNDPINNPNAWKPVINNEPQFTEKAGNVLNIISTIGIIIAVISLVTIGIKYMLGSVEEKAEYKKTLVPYLIGIILLGACTTIPKIIFSIINKVIN